MFGKIKYISDNTAIVSINKEGNVISNLMNLHVVFENGSDLLLGEVKNIDEEWVKAIEEALPALQTVVLNPRKFIEEDREVVNIAMARNISPESIQHLLQSSNTYSLLRKFYRFWCFDIPYL